MSQFGARNRRQDMSGLVGDLKPAPGADPVIFDGFVSQILPPGNGRIGDRCVQRRKNRSGQVLVDASFGVKVKKIERHRKSLWYVATITESIVRKRELKERSPVSLILLVPPIETGRDGCWPSQRRRSALPAPRDA